MDNHNKKLIYILILFITVTFLLIHIVFHPSIKNDDDINTIDVEETFTHNFTEYFTTLESDIIIEIKEKEDSFPIERIEYACNPIELEYSDFLQEILDIYKNTVIEDLLPGYTMEDVYLLIEYIESQIMCGGDFNGTE